jgi:hypothetical protein
VGALLTDEFQPGLAIGCVEHVPAFDAKNLAHRFAELSVVVNDEDSFHRE